MTDDTRALSRLTDEAAIRDATARFADAAMRGDHDAFRAVWAADAKWIIGDPPRVQAEGADDIVAMLGKLRSGRDFFVQFALQGSIAIDGDTAVTTCLCHEAARGPGEHYYRNHCIASDRLQRAGSEWVFSERVFRYIWLDTSPFGGDAFSLASNTPTTL